MTAGEHINKVVQQFEEDQLNHLNQAELGLVWEIIYMISKHMDSEFDRELLKSLAGEVVNKVHKDNKVNI